MENSPKISKSLSRFKFQSFRILLFLLLLLLYGGRRSSYVMVEPVWNLAAAVDEIEIEVE
jgi:hypothetical protein